MKLSIITVNYNNLDGLKRTAESILAQSFRDFEWIIIDGGSTDGSAELVSKLSHEPNANISFSVSENDNGVYNAMNKGIGHARGNFINFMNSGDCFSSKDILDSVFSVDYVEDILIGDSVFRDNGEIFSSIKNKNLDIYFWMNSSLPHQSMFIKKSLFECYGLYDENLRILSDYKHAFVSIYFGNASYRYIPFIICNYQGNGISTSPSIVDERRSVVNSLVPTRVQKDILNYYEYKQRIDFMNKYAPTKFLLKATGYFAWVLSRFELK